MKKQLFPVAGLMALAVVLMSATSCVKTSHSLPLDEGQRVTESRFLKGFEKIEVVGSPTVYYTQARELYRGHSDRSECQESRYPQSG